jgi:hypothetical protein
MSRFCIAPAPQQAAGRRERPIPARPQTAHQQASPFADVITDWNENTVTFVTPGMAPAAGQRVVAIKQVAMFDAINSIDRLSSELMATRRRSRTPWQ